MVGSSGERERMDTGTDSSLSSIFTLCGLLLENWNEGIRVRKEFAMQEEWTLKVSSASRGGRGTGRIRPLLRAAGWHRLAEQEA